METIEMVINRWIDEEDVRYTHTHICAQFNYKKEGNSAICDNMDGL